MSKRTENQSMEPVIMIGEEWNQLRFRAIEKDNFLLSNVNDISSSNVVNYREGIDYEVDYEKGQIRRLPGSSIPDFRTNKAYGVKPRSIDLDIIESFEFYHCSGFTAYASYQYDGNSNESYEEVLEKINRQNQTALPKKLARAIKERKPLLYAVVGDSISTGAEAAPGKEYFTLFAEYVESLGVKMEICNVAIGGRDSNDAVPGIERIYQEKGVMPDLVTVAYGMNDQNNLFGNEPGVSSRDYINNLRLAVEKIKSYATDCPEIIMISSMPANPIWNYTSGGSTVLAAALREFAKQEELPIADANALFHRELKYGKRYEELIFSLINHPGNYGHYLYYLTLKSILDEALGSLEE